MHCMQHQLTSVNYTATMGPHLIFFLSLLHFSASLAMASVLKVIDSQMSAHVDQFPELEGVMFVQVYFTLFSDRS